MGPEQMLLPERRLDEIVKEYSGPKRKPPGDDIRQIRGLLNAAIDTGLNPDVKGNHLSASINAISSIIQALRIKGQNPEEDAIWNEPIWSRCFALYLDRSNSAKSKVMRSFLTLLLSLLSDCNVGNRRAILKLAVEKLRHVLSGNSGHGSVKAALSTLKLLLSKQILSLEEFLDLFFINSDQPNSLNDVKDIYLQTKEATETIVEWAGYHDIAPTAAQTLGVILRLYKSSPSSDKDMEPLWAVPIFRILESNPHALPSFQSNLFPVLFASDVNDYYKFLRSLKVHDRIDPNVALNKSRDADDESETSLLFAALQVGAELGIVVNQDSKESQKIALIDGIIVLPPQSLRHALFNGPARSRFTVLRVLISSPSTTKPLNPRTLQLLRESLPIFYMDTDQGVRGDFIALIKHFLLRLRAIIFHLNNVVKKQAKDLISTAYRSQEDLSRLHEHKRFVSWIVEDATLQLRPGNSYQCHFCALKILLFAVQSGLDEKSDAIEDMRAGAQWLSRKTVFSETLFDALYNLTQDPFEDIRSLSAELLAFGFTSRPEKMLGKNFLRHFEYAYRQMISSGRNDETDGLARVQALMYQCSQDPALQVDRILHSLEAFLEERIYANWEEKSTRLVEIPMHGPLSALRYILDTGSHYKPVQEQTENERQFWLTFHRRIFATLPRVWNAVRDVLCVDAPEGFVPEEVKDTDVDTKDLLSYAWRALKEASLLISVIARRCSLQTEATSGFMSVTDLDGLTSFSYTALTELRHRGAFSAVAQAFGACCARNYQEGRQDALQRLYDLTLRTISEQGSVITRRSAGIPSLVLGILTANPNGPLFSSALSQLFEMGRSSQIRQPNESVVSLPQVHALNCLRSIFTSNILGSYSESYIADALSLAGTCLTSDIWPIRNSGLMLFRSLVDRLLGTTEVDDSQDLSPSKKTSRFSYTTYPDLLPMVIQFLEPSDEQLFSPEASIESVFPALKLVQRAPPRDHDRRIRKAILRLLCSSHWHVRDMAARAFCAVVEEQSDSATIIRELLDDAIDRPQNEVHGRILAVKHVVKDLKPNPDVTGVIHQYQEQLDTRNACPYTREAFADVVALSRMRAAEENNHTGPEISEKFLHALHNGNTLSPSAVEESIQLWAANLMRSSSGAHFSQDWIEKVNTFHRAIKVLLSESKAFPIRFAATSALKTFWYDFKEQKELNQGVEYLEIRLRGLLLIYDALNDDDEEIRDIAAETAPVAIGSTAFAPAFASRVVPKTIVDLVRSSRTQNMMFRLTSTKSRHLCFDAIERMLSIRFKSAQIVPSAKSRFARITAQDTSLFRIEKENLYIDATREAVVWATVLKNLPSTQIKAHAVGVLESWILTALTLIVSDIEKTQGRDIPLWSRPQCFELGIQVLSGVDVLLCWSVRKELRPFQVDSGKIMELAIRFLGTSKRKGLNQILILKTERILQRHIPQLLAKRGRQLQLLGN